MPFRIASFSPSASSSSGSSLPRPISFKNSHVSGSGGGIHVLSHGHRGSYLKTLCASIRAATSGGKLMSSSIFSCVHADSSHDGMSFRRTSPSMDIQLVRRISSARFAVAAARSALTRSRYCSAMSSNLLYKPGVSSYGMYSGSGSSCRCTSMPCFSHSRVTHGGHAPGLFSKSNSLAVLTCHGAGACSGTASGSYRIHSRSCRKPSWYSSSSRVRGVFGSMSNRFGSGT
mmetsp:Transcript_12858/g.46208  ORF Transcript_12858/g.46208 Transcript_12858/m.46208 type:complete len:230 (-) Transcript_12858:139-828(-)|eukprot:31396-Pelagococcus_subviridis.AAC.11